MKPKTEKWTRVAILNDLFEMIRKHEKELPKKGYASITAYINAAIAEKLKDDGF